MNSVIDDTLTIEHNFTAYIRYIITLINGENRHSQIPGCSVHNQRIERLWKDVFTQVIEKY